jgi:hypothetical protein
MQSEVLIQTLTEQTRVIINQLESLRNEDLNTLTWRENPISWNILECIEHINRYGDFYLPEIASKIKISNTNADTVFKSGWLGSYFAKSMAPKDKLNKMATFKDKNPLNAQLNQTVIDTCINQQMELLDLLQQSRFISLNKVKINVSISKFIKLKLGDTFQFFINHIRRHLVQIENTKAKSQTTKLS